MAGTLYIVYDYFELEGIPPYPSYFTPVDFKYTWWIDLADTRNFRFEKRFALRDNPDKAGLVACSTGNALDQKNVKVEWWDSAPQVYEEKSSPNAVKYEEWLNAFNTRGRLILNKATDDTFQRLEDLDDPVWGRTYHFRETGYIIGGSDLYLNLPFVTTYQFGVDDLRWIEMNRVVINNSDEVLHRLWRLAEWKEIPGEISLDWTIPQNEP